MDIDQHDPMHLNRVIEELYQLFLISTELEHGVRDGWGQWRLFEASQFVYAYFTFNSVYNFDWQQSLQERQAITWEMQRIDKSADLPRESAKQREMLKVIYEHLGDRVIDDFPRTMDKYLRDVRDLDYVLRRIVVDVRITQESADQFLENLTSLMSARLSKSAHRDALKNCLYFIYQVRNNLFHGSKTLMDLDPSQQERFKVYRAILSTVLELFFNAVDTPSGGLISLLAPRHASQRQPRFLPDHRDWDQGFRGISVAVPVPEGSLFYPACGNDLEHPLDLFWQSVSEFHFADIQTVHVPEILIPTRKLNRHGEYVSIPVRADRAFSELANQIVDAELRLTYDYANPPPKGTRNGLHTRFWTLADQRVLKLLIHYGNAYTAFQRLDQIAVFYYRGDSNLEGGSGIKWFGPQLFHELLDKLVDGGLIVTDGSNWDSEHLDVEWAGLFRHNLIKRPDFRRLQQHTFDYYTFDQLPVPENFRYAGREFRLIQQVGRRYGPVYLWQVVKL